MTLIGTKKPRSCERGLNGGESRIRTSELIREQIYSLRALATCISHLERGKAWTVGLNPTMPSNFLENLFRAFSDRSAYECIAA